jgi:hypothetical protein
MTNEPTLYSDWNTYVRDNELYFYQQVVTNPREKILVSSGYQLQASSAAEIDVCSGSLAGGLLSTNNTLLYYMNFGYLNNVSAGKTITVKIYYGTTSQTIFSSALGNNAGWDTFWAYGFVSGYNGTSAQRANGYTVRQMYDAAVTVVGSSTIASFTEDSTAAKTVKFTMQMGESNANEQFAIYYASIKLATIGTAS